MRFEEFVEQNSIAVVPVERFSGFFVEVGVPSGWEIFHSATGIRVWLCRDDPRDDVFCANAVLTMDRVEAPIDAAAVFAMLVDQQLHSVPGARELRRELGPATEGAGVVGTLTMQIADALGSISSVSRSRIITLEQETVIAQLTLSALADSPRARANVWLSVRPGAQTDSAFTDRHGIAPVSGTRGVDDYR
ncbi:hypothetical protein MAUB1S_01099 [Mycolicibacterium aubagnense]